MCKTCVTFQCFVPIIVCRPIMKTLYFAVLHLKLKHGYYTSFSSSSDKIMILQLVLIKPFTMNSSNRNHWFQAGTYFLISQIIQIACTERTRPSYHQTIISYRQKRQILPLLITQEYSTDVVEFEASVINWS